MTYQLNYDDIDPKHTALLVIDPQYDLCSEYLADGKTKTPLARMSDEAGIDPPAYDFSLYPAVLENLQPVLNAARKAGVLVIYTQATRLPQVRTKTRNIHLARIYRIDPTKIEVPLFAVPGTPGWEFVDEIKPQPGDVVIQKSRQSGFVGTPLYLVLKNNGIRSLVVGGCQTEGCVESTLRDGAYSYDYTCYPIEDCIASFTKEMHNLQMQLFKRRFNVIQSKQVIQLWASK